MPTITLNGEERGVDAEATISSLLDSLGIRREGTAVAVNSEVVPRELHGARKIQEGDRVDIIRAIGGG